MELDSTLQLHLIVQLLEAELDPKLEDFHRLTHSAGEDRREFAKNLALVGYNVDDTCPIIPKALPEALQKEFHVRVRQFRDSHDKMVQAHGEERGFKAGYEAAIKRIKRILTEHEERMFQRAHEGRPPFPRY